MRHLSGNAQRGLHLAQVLMYLACLMAHPPLTHALVPPRTDACFPLTPTFISFWVHFAVHVDPGRWQLLGHEVERRRLFVHAAELRTIAPPIAREGVETFAGQHSLSGRGCRDLRWPMQSIWTRVPRPSLAHTVYLNDAFGPNP